MSTLLFACARLPVFASSVPGFAVSIKRVRACFPPPFSLWFHVHWTIVSLSLQRHNSTAGPESPLQIIHSMTSPRPLKSLQNAEYLGPPWKEPKEAPGSGNILFSSMAAEFSQHPPVSKHVFFAGLPSHACARLPFPPT